MADEDTDEDEEFSDLDRNLCVAAEQNNATAVHQTIRNGANVNCVDRHSDSDRVHEHTPLMKACEEGHDEIVRILLDAGADASWQTWLGSSAMSSACFFNRLSTIQILLNHDNDLLEIEECFRMTPLMAAAYYRDPDVVRLLIDRGANVHAITDMTPKGSTALIQACRVSEMDFAPVIEIVRMLVDAGVDLEARDCDEYQATALYYAVEYGDENIVRFLLESGASPDATAVGADTPLMMACGNTDTNLEIVRLLLAAGADTTARDSTQHTALHYAAHNFDTDILRELMLEPHANIFAVVEDGSTPFDLAAKGEYKPLFIEPYGNKMTQDHGRLALHAILCSATYSFVEYSKFHPPLRPTLLIHLQLGKLRCQHFRTLLNFLDNDLLRNRNDMGMLPIHIACQANAPVEVLSMLVEIDPATLHIADHCGALPIHYLLLNGSGIGTTPPECASVQHLVEQGGIGTLTARTPQNGFLPLHTCLHGSALPS